MPTSNPNGYVHGACSTCECDLGDFLSVYMVGPDECLCPGCYVSAAAAGELGGVVDDDDIEDELQAIIDEGCEVDGEEAILCCECGAEVETEWLSGPTLCTECASDTEGDDWVSNRQCVDCETTDSDAWFVDEGSDVAFCSDCHDLLSADFDEMNGGEW